MVHMIVVASSLCNRFSQKTLLVGGTDKKVYYIPSKLFHGVANRKKDSSGNSEIYDTLRGLYKPQTDKSHR